jgi:hypothetical protein
VWVGGHLLAGIVGSNPISAWNFASCERCVLASRVLCVGLIFCQISPTECGVSSECECGVMTLNRTKALQKKH